MIHKFFVCRHGARIDLIDASNIDDAKSMYADDPTIRVWPAAVLDLVDDLSYAILDIQRMRYDKGQLMEACHQVALLAHAVCDAAEKSCHVD